MKYIIDTLGCKVNQFESQGLDALLRERGHSPAAPGEADAVIVNTCAVTTESERKSRQAVHRLMDENPGAALILCGCWAQIDEEGVKELSPVVVYGSGERRKLVEAVERAVEAKTGIVSLDPPFERRRFEVLPVGAFAGHARAYLKLEDGCVNFCTYCIIPYARGRVRSLPPDTAAEQAAELDAKGYRETVLTGIELASYGRDLKQDITLKDVVLRIAEAAPHMRLRLGSLEPTIVTEDFCRALAATGRICDHFHLSLQSGCDDTLRRMNRKYDTAGFLEATVLLRKYFPGCALTADLIVGFPGEAEADHNVTLDFIDKCRFMDMHIFPYSRRPGTPADEMDGQVPNSVRARRASEAEEVVKRMKQSYLVSCVGKTLPVLFETEAEGVSTGHASNYTVVSASGTGLRGVIRNVKITGVSGEMLVGDVV